jgi:hypothetical protein
MISSRPTSSLDLAAWNRVSTVFGMVAWLGALALFLRDADVIASTETLLLLALLVITPAALGLVGPNSQTEASSIAYRSAVLLQPFAAVLAAASFAPSNGLAAAALAVPWLGFTGLVALYGLQRLIAVRLTRIEEVCTTVGLLYLPIGAVWLVLARLGARPLGFGDLIVFLTAIHFHFIPLTALVITGLVGRRLRALRPSVWPIYRVAALGVIVGPALVAAGITTSSTLIEAVSTLVVAGSMLTVAALALVMILPTTHPRLAKVLLTVSFAALFITMPLAIAYATGRWTNGWAITIPQMIQGHGWVNALGFGLCGLLAWRWVTSKS